MLRQELMKHLLFWQDKKIVKKRILKIRGGPRLDHIKYILFKLIILISDQKILIMYSHEMTIICNKTKIYQHGIYYLVKIETFSIKINYYIFGRSPVSSQCLVALVNHSPQRPKLEKGRQIDQKKHKIKACCLIFVAAKEIVFHSRAIFISITTMASVAAPKAKPYSLSHANFQRLNSSHKFSTKIPFFSDPPSPRLVLVHSNNPNLDSIKMDQTVSGFGSGTESPTDLHASSSPSAAIDFLTLCHRLKVLGELYICMFLSFAVVSLVLFRECIDEFVLFAFFLMVFFTCDHQKRG